MALPSLVLGPGDRIEVQIDVVAALAACQHANFAWWNDEHNFYIDLRATIPMRRACTPDMIPRVARLTCDAAAEISRRMGYRFRISAPGAG